MRNRWRRAPLLALGAITAALALPAAAQATVFTFTNGDTAIQVPAGGTLAGPADLYPNAINVTQPGTVASVQSVTLSAVVHQKPDDIDAALVAPNGTAVHLMSDTCGGDANVIRPRVFSDSGATFLGASPASSCNPAFNPVLVTNFVGGDEPAADPQADFYPPPGPASGTLNKLAFFAGGPAAGAWKLFVNDDTINNSGSIGGWQLTMDITPPATPPTTTPPGNPTSPINPAGNIRQRKCKKKKKTTKSAEVAKKKKCKKKKKV